MSKKKSKKVSDGDDNDGAQQKQENNSSNQKGNDGGKKEGSGGGAIVLKMDLHCQGCASKVVKRIRGYEGVENVKVDSDSNKLMVTGKFDPGKLREKLEQKTHKKVELLTPVPKKDKDDAKSKDAGGDGKEEKKDAKENKATDKDNSKNKNKQDEKKSKEPPVTTAVLKVPLDCDGCIQKIKKIVSKTKGHEEIKLDKQKDLVTVKGAMDMKVLADKLRKHLKRDVEIVPPKKDEKKEKGSGGEGKSKGGVGDGGDSGSSGGVGGEKIEGNRMQFQFGYGIPSPYVYGPGPGPMYGPGPGPMYGPGPGYVGDPYQFHYPHPQMFSDENPNACSVM